MLYVITVRRENERVAHAHIVATGSTRAFCGVAIPPFIFETGIDDPRNPYVGKARVTCLECISEHASGRTSGYLGDVQTDTAAAEG